MEKSLSEPLLSNDSLGNNFQISDTHIESKQVSQPSQSLSIDQSQYKKQKDGNDDDLLRKKIIARICPVFSFLSLPVAAFFESLDSFLGIGMVGIVVCEAVHSHAFYYALGVAGFLGALIWFYTYKLLAIKKQEEHKKDVDKLNINCMANVFFFLTAIAAGLDAGAALAQQTVQRWDSSRFIASVFLVLGVLSLVCRAAKYYISDLGTQISNPEKLTFIRWFTEKSKCIRKTLQGAVFQLFPFGEAVAHLLAAYIIYSDLIQPYFSGNLSLALTLGSMGVLIGCFAFFAQYVIICAADLDWAARTLDKKKEGISEQIDNRFGLVGQVLLGCAAYTTLLWCYSAQTAFKRLRWQIKWSKILGQGVFVGAGSLLLVSIICAGLLTSEVVDSSEVAGSIPAITIHHTTIPAWGFALGVFMLGYIPGTFLGYRQWKAKNDAGNEVDCFIARFVNHYEWRDDEDKKFNCINNKAEKNLPPIWMATDQEHEDEPLSKRLYKKRAFFVCSFLVGAMLGVGYSIETLGSDFNQLIVNIKLYGFAAIGGVGFMIAAFIIIAIGRKELLYKEKSSNDNVLDNSNKNIKKEADEQKTSLSIEHSSEMNMDNKVKQPTHLM